MASKLGVTALYVTPTQESGGGPLTPGPPRIAATDCCPPAWQVCRKLNKVLKMSASGADASFINDGLLQAAAHAILQSASASAR